MSNIDSRSCVSKNAIIGKNVIIGPFTVIEDNVEIGEGTVIGANCMVGSFTRVGKNNHFFNNSSVGTAPQDLKYKGEKTFLVIGDNNTVREFVTINRACGEDEVTQIGNNCFFMAYSHVAHNCILGNHVVMANLATLAGHIEIDDNVVIGGLAGIHQFVKIGCNAMVGGMSKIIKDVVPYALVDGHPPNVFGPNVIGLKRHGFKKSDISLIKTVYKVVFDSNHTLKESIKQLESDFEPIEVVTKIIEFLKSSDRGIIR
ncbi:acyl-ACP--UDP-N-acetylglucosamine O-acyltransferase [bacterium]|nr:acyl-ACP--UDP-N-acetylglucosamine O-acyltransferase [bacterium]